MNLHCAEQNQSAPTQITEQIAHLKLPFALDIEGTGTSRAAPPSQAIAMRFAAALTGAGADNVP